jgi:hypothetical protein
MYDEFPEWYWNICSLCFTGIDYITGENFLDMLDNGVIVCHLAQVIQERAKQVVNIGSPKSVSCTSH